MTGTSATPTPGAIGIVSATLMTAVAGYIDAFLFLRHQVFGFAQTGNVIFLAVGLVKDGDWVRYVWPLLAYLAGLVVAQLIRTYSPALPRHIVGAALAFQLAVFAILAFLSTNAPAWLFVIPLSFVGGIRLELFRSAGGISFVSIATTGNLMRFVQALGDLARDRSSARLRAAAFTAFVVAAFLVGALCGAFISEHVGPALWGAVVLEAASVAVYVAQTRRPSVIASPD